MLTDGVEKVCNEAVRALICALAGRWITALLGERDIAFWTDALSH